MSRLKNYDENDALLEEWMTLSKQKTEIVRRVFSIWDIFGKVGGVANIFKIFATMIFTKYAQISFQTEAVNSLIDVKTVS